MNTLGHADHFPVKAAVLCRFWLRLIAHSLLAGLFAIQADAQNPASAFDAANKLYDQGKYAEAAAGFEKFLPSGQASPALYFNLGNAFFKSGQIGRAIAAYRRAEQLAPRDPDVRANLRFARNQTQGPTLAAGPAERFLLKLTLNEWTLLASAALWLLFLLLAFLQWRPALQRTSRVYVIALAISAVLLWGTSAAAFYQDRLIRTAIVVTRDVAVRQGPLDASPTAFTLQDGAELRILDQKDDWFQVTTDPRRIGWLRRDQVLLAIN
jgi:tetratricopeptide (TPR) repeat protein